MRDMLICCLWSTVNSLAVVKPCERLTSGVVFMAANGETLLGRRQYRAKPRKRKA